MLGNLSAVDGTAREKQRMEKTSTRWGVLVEGVSEEGWCLSDAPKHLL